MPGSIAAFVRSEDGQDLIEYALVAALLALGCVLTFSKFAGGVNGYVSNEFNTLESYM
jgi:Flp pilus assembly pilin Flp